VEPQFRLAEPDDLALLLDLMGQFYAIDGYPFETASARAALATLVEDATRGRLWLIERDGAAVGYLALTFGYSLEYRGRDAFIDELFIVAAQRRQGLGTRAMHFAIAQCRQLGVRALHLEVERTNVAGQALYRKLGFADHDRFLMTRGIEDSGD
jgi:ribosomal protein S18 acetylase RimI-like enzyme